MTTETISFFYSEKKHSKKKLIKWAFEHNLPSTFGLSLENAFDSWSERCDDPTDPHAFIEYVKSKDPLNIKCKLIV